MQMKFVAALALAGAVLSAAAPAAAQTYDFSLTGANTASFSLPASPTPAFGTPGAFFVIEGVNGVFNSNNTVFSIGFGSPIYLAEFALFGPAVGGGGLILNGPVLYTGTEAAPTFSTGTFALENGYSLTISSSAGAIPEPSSWAMMITGMGALGLALRARRRRTVAA